MSAHVELRRILGHFATGVTVVTTRDVAHNPLGCTANAFTTLSLVPPLILVCISQQSQTHGALQVDPAIFAVNILTRRQEDLSRHFASKRPDKFRTVAHHDGITGVPLLEGVLAFLECRVVDRLARGDHTVLFGQILHLGAAAEGDPLLFYRGAYTAMEGCQRSLAPREQELEHRERLVVSSHPW
jgi:flavin reductase (DIM6/NTAB) family NADH-FMN oxidoreductase RutF